MNLSKNKITKGFTLIEILLVVALIAILAVVVFAALNPAQRFSDTRDARRTQDVNTYLTAIHECIIDNQGDFTACGLANPMEETEVGSCAAGAGTSCSGEGTPTTNCVDLATDLSDYLTSVPTDPDGGSSANTDYTVRVANGQVSVYACGTEGATTIQASR